MKINPEESEFFKKNWNTYKELLFKKDIDEKLVDLKKEILNTKERGGRLIFYGNGASASLSSHAATDFSKQAKVEALAMNDHNLVTAFSNDYGYSKWVEKSLEVYAKKNDLIFFLSVSGQSENLINGLNFAKRFGLKTISFTGCAKENFLKNNSDYSLWVDSWAYNIVESIHTIWITSLIDLIIGKPIYCVN